MTDSFLNRPRILALHYTAPPVVGGVEAVLHAHAQAITEAGYPFGVLAGRGEETALPPPARFFLMPKLDTQHPEILAMGQALEQGQVPKTFSDLSQRIAESLSGVIERFDRIIVHNVFTKHFNLPLTAALFHLLEHTPRLKWIAWCHDFTWTSPNAPRQVHSGYPWDLLRTPHERLTYVVVSEARQQELARLFHLPAEPIRVIYNGVEPGLLLGLSAEGASLVRRLNLLNNDLILLMPVRVTKAKNIEYAMQVVAALKHSGLKPKLVVTGPPDPHDDQSMTYYLSLQALRQSLGLENEFRFVYESGPDQKSTERRKTTGGYVIDARIVGDLFRVADVMFLPSLREGFGMPVLEAGLAGIQVVSSEIPAAREIGGQDIIQFDLGDEPQEVARQILRWTETSSVYRLRVRIRQNYTWQAIFYRQIEPLLQEGLKP